MVVQSPADTRRRPEQPAQSDARGPIQTEMDLSPYKVHNSGPYTAALCNEDGTIVRTWPTTSLAAAEGATRNAKPGQYVKLIGGSVFPDWMQNLPFQQQSVLVLGLRGPDGDPKHTPFKHLLRAYRGTVLKAAKYGRPLEFGEKADSFMTMEVFADLQAWDQAIETFLEDAADGSILHHYTHFMHGAQILGYKHPSGDYRARWLGCYLAFVKRLHLNPESVLEMDARLSDWDQKHWRV